MGETYDPVASSRRVTGMSDELAQNVVAPVDLPPGYQLEGPGEPGNRWSEQPR
jgi:hypothetical protein